ncbi:PucR family transcriptional regulator [Streptomyces sp. NPDC048278]|uniref:PucR family transcriptional regulator n=1 Tax=Streptomyces sp. NPDC048278 TaxID=3155809 RepID=UPI003413B7EB
MDESATGAAAADAAAAAGAAADAEQPSVRLGVLLADPDLGLTQVAGPAAGDRLAGTVGTTELEDPTPYLVGGELLLTSGVRLPGDADGIDTYVRRVVAAGVAALGFGVAPVHDEVPPELVRACDRHGLPLLRLPPATPFVAVGQAAYAAIGEARNRELREISRAQSALASAAARPDALRAVLGQLAAHTGAWSVLYDAQGTELLSAGRRPASPHLLRDLAVRTLRQAGGPTAAATHDPDRGGHLTVHALPVGGDRTTAVTLALGQAASVPPTAVHRQVTGTATVLLALLTGPRHALSTDTHSVGALVRLMLGATPAEVAPELVPGGTADGAAGGTVHGHWTVVRGRYPDGTPPAAVPARLAALASLLGTPYVHIDGPDLKALVPCAADARPQVPARAAELGWVLGYSAPVAAGDLPHADTQAERALHRALAAGTPAVVHTTDPLTLHTLVDPADARELARTRFARLDRAGQPGAPVLLDTLRTWLTLHGSWDRTAALLGVHRNTVRHRLARVSDLLDIDLQDPGVRMELWFALQWLPDEAPHQHP